MGRLIPVSGSVSVTPTKGDTMKGFVEVTKVCAISLALTSTLMPGAWAQGKVWVSVDRANRHTCPSENCGVVGQLMLREAVIVLEKNLAGAELQNHILHPATMAEVSMLILKIPRAARKMELLTVIFQNG